MDKCPRRSLLGGIGTTITLGVAGCLSRPDDGASTAPGNDSSQSDAEDDAAEDDADDGDAAASETDDDQFTPLLEYLPASLGDEIVLFALDVSTLSEVDDPYMGGTPSIVGDFAVDESSITTMVAVENQAEYSNPITVLGGNVTLEDDGDARETSAGVTYEFYEGDERVAGALEDALVIAESETRLEESLEAGSGAGVHLADAEPVFADALEAVPDADRQHVFLPGPDDEPDDVLDPAAVRFATHAITVVDPDTMEITLAVEFDDADDVTDDVLERLEDDLAGQPGHDEPTVTVDDAFVVASTTLDLVAMREAEERRQETDSPRFRSPREIDFDADYVELEITQGDPTPVEELTLEVGDEAYDPDIWTDGQDTIAEGDTIRIAMEEVEPNLSLRLRHEFEYGGSSSGTTLLSTFRFDTAYDLESETLELTYEDDHPLDGDHLHLAVFGADADFRDPPLESSQPWAGEVLAEGASASLEGVSPGQRAIVGWKGDERGDSIFSHQPRPPGFATADYDYEAQTLSVSLELEESRPASEFTLLVEDEPAARQWADEGTTVEDGATVTLEDVDVGTNGVVVWGDDEVRVTGFSASPSVDLELREGGSELAHVGGPALPVERLELRVRTADDLETVSVEDPGEAFSEGETITLDADEVEHVTLTYDGHVVGHAWQPRD
ncbi:hypothetical protein [Natronobiforma cellulositropha]|uniref:hypothetical protein n=1 Tax=Natronobiforma cellulositropha TaxID=1679076 RepID=UPI0021D5CBAC|nr:hypothetical protein [Natronobiforma cellulositropha]